MDGEPVPDPVCSARIGSGLMTSGVDIPDELAKAESNISCSGDTRAEEAAEGIRRVRLGSAYSAVTSSDQYYANTRETTKRPSDLNVLTIKDTEHGKKYPRILFLVQNLGGGPLQRACLDSGCGGPSSTSKAIRHVSFISQNKHLKPILPSSRALPF